MREPEEVTEARRDLGARLARLRHAKGISQHRFAPLTHYGRSTVANVETGRQKASRDFWQRCDELLSTGGVLVRAFDDLELRARRAALQTSTRSQPRSFATPTLPAFPLTDYMTDDDITIARDRLMDIVSLDNQFGGADLAAMCLRFFRSVHQRLGSGAYAPSVEVDLQALLGEIAEVAGWLCYDADRQDEVRRLNHEALYFSRLAGDRQMELLVLQNTSMHAGHLGRSHEALQVARSVLEGPYQLSPRLTSLFLIRKARAMAQAGDASALRLLREARALYEDGLRDDDPAWTWWVDERELSWHEAMALADLGQRGIAVGRFEQAVVATPDDQTRSRYLHLGYLFAGQVAVGAWHEAAGTLSRLHPLSGEVASTRTSSLVRMALQELERPTRTGGSRTEPPDTLLHVAQQVERTLRAVSSI